MLHRPAKKGLTCLHIACEHGRREVVAMLLRAGGDVLLRRRTDDGSSSLLFACRQGHSDVVDLLLAARGDAQDIFVTHSLRDDLGIVEMDEVNPEFEAARWLATNRRMRSERIAAEGGGGGGGGGGGSSEGVGGNSVDASSSSMHGGADEMP
jgi:ankyrin repeat protein